jgi:transposase
MTHDYKRNGTTTLFAALETLQGKVVGECHARHRHQEFLRFLRRLDNEFPGEVPLHLIMDNYGTHKHAKVKALAEASSPVRVPFRPYQFWSKSSPAAPAPSGIAQRFLQKRT